jgi:DNA-binding transcriptional ArsR family regulator
MDASMTGPGQEHDARFADALSSLGSPVRIAILRQLRVPRTLREIEVRLAPQAEGPKGRARPLARQTIREHLDRLLQIGVVATRDTERSGRPTTEYLLNHQALFALGEEFWGLAALTPEHELGGPTVPGPAGKSGFFLDGPSLVLVRGIGEGRIFSLAALHGTPRRWIIGRSRGTDIPLDFDPYISSENAAVEWDGQHYWLRDLPESRNGTRVNFTPLPRPERRALTTGDLIGIGRTLLMFRA